MSTIELKLPLKQGVAFVLFHNTLHGFKADFEGGCDLFKTESTVKVGKLALMLREKLPGVSIKEGDSFSRKCISVGVKDYERIPEVINAAIEFLRIDKTPFRNGDSAIYKMRCPRLWDMSKSHNAVLLEPNPSYFSIRGSLRSDFNIVLETKLRAPYKLVYEPTEPTLTYSPEQSERLFLKDAAAWCKDTDANTNSVVYSIACRSMWAGKDRRACATQELYDLLTSRLIKIEGGPLKPGKLSMKLFACVRSLAPAFLFKCLVSTSLHRKQAWYRSPKGKRPLQTTTRWKEFV